VYGEGILSIREKGGAAKFWTGVETNTATIDDLTLTLSPCSKDCQVKMPWGVHERSRHLSVVCGKESLSVWLTESGGYKFMDVDVAPSTVTATLGGVLGQAVTQPLALQQLVKEGREDSFKLCAAPKIAAP